MLILVTLLILFWGLHGALLVWLLIEVLRLLFGRSRAAYVVAFLTVDALVAKLDLALAAGCPTPDRAELMQLAYGELAAFSLVAALAVRPRLAPRDVEERPAGRKSLAIRGARLLVALLFAACAVLAASWAIQHPGPP